jgi:hypothetical protein
MAITATIYGGAVQLTGNPIKVKVSGVGTLPAGAIDYKYLLKVISVDSDLVGAPFTDSIVPDASLEAMFDISGYVDQPVNYGSNFPFQFPSGSPVIEHTSQMVEIQVQPGERYIDSDGDLQENLFSVSASFFVLKGGLSQRQLNLWSGAGKTFYSEYLTAKHFLTQRPSGDVIHPTQPVRLWFAPIAGDSVKLDITGYYDDDTTQNYQSSITLDISKLYELNCNPAHSAGMDLYDGVKRMLYFVVKLTKSGATYGEVRTFYIDWNYCERPFFIMFQNSLGGIDDVHMAGFAAENYNTEGTVISKPAGDYDTEYDPTLFTPNRKGQNVFRLNTGWKTQTQMRHIRDMLVSQRVWLLYPNLAVSSYTVIPVIVTNTGSELVDYQKDLLSLDIEIAEAHSDQYVFDNRLF